jgi:hypothetical protein
VPFQTPHLSLNTSQCLQKSIISDTFCRNMKVCYLLQKTQIIFCSFFLFKEMSHCLKDTDGREVPFAVSLKLDTSLCDLNTKAR